MNRKQILKKISKLQYIEENENNKINVWNTVNNSKIMDPFSFIRLKRKREMGEREWEKTISEEIIARLLLH